MKKIFSFILITLFVTVYAHAAVAVPDFSFTGQDEIAGFSIRPSFKHVSVSFSVQSSFDSYLRQEMFEMQELDSKAYTSAEPGGMYSGSIGTALSSVFVGEKAYRNNIVKAYLNKQYLSVIQSYNDYYKKIEKTKYAEEVNLVYAFSLLETGSLTNAFKIIKTIATGDGELRNVAADRYAKYVLETRSFEDFDAFASELKSVTPYTLYAWLYSLQQQAKYERVMQVYEDHQEITNADPRFADFYLTARYSLGGFDDVVAAKDKATENTAGIIADSCLVNNDTACARSVYDKIPEGSVKKVIYAKIAIAENRNSDAVRALKALDADEDKLNILLYYVSKEFPKLDVGFMEQFPFASKINDDYVKFYEGLYYLSNGDNQRAINCLDGIIFNKDLVNTSYYYRGLAYASIDRQRSQVYLLKFLELSSDKQKITVTRYMLGQFYYLDNRYDDAMMLVRSCTTSYCNVLKAKIFLEKRDLSSAWNSVDKVVGDDASLVRGSILYKRKMYSDAIKQIKLIRNTDDQSDLLLLLCYLKMDDTKSAGVIFDKHSNDSRFMNAYIEDLFLTGQYQKVLDVTNNDKSNFAVIRAKALFSLGKSKESAAQFRAIIASGQNSFDAWYGLLSSYQAMGDQQKFTDTAKEITTVDQIFDKKDFLILQTAKMALDSKDTRLATLMLNHFFDTFTISVYMKEAHLLRGQLFRDTGRIDQCLADADAINQDDKSDDADFLKAECLITSDKPASIKIFEGLAKDSDRFRDLSYGKLVEMYDAPKDILHAAEYFKGKDSASYYKGMDRYFGKLSPSELAENKPLLDKMISDGDPAGLPEAYYYKGLISYNSKEYEDSARIFMKGYYLYPDTPFGQQSLRKAIDAYDQLGKKDEAAVMRSKLKK